LSNQLGLHDVVAHLGYRPHHESLSYVMGADALLLVGGAHRWEETGKVFEYVVAGRPILALLKPDGAAADLLRRSGNARIVARDSVAETVAALRDLMYAAPSPSVQPPDWLADHRRDALARKIARILEAAVPTTDPVLVRA